MKHEDTPTDACNEPKRRSVKEVVTYAKNMHIHLIKWAESHAERTIVLATMQELETQTQTLMRMELEYNLKPGG